MTVTITIASPTGSELPLEAYLQLADLTTPVSADSDNYWLATTATFLGGAVELHFGTPNSDFTFDGSEIPNAGSATSLQIFSVALNMVVATITGFTQPISDIYGVILSFQQGGASSTAGFILNQEIAYTGDIGSDEFVGGSKNDTINGGKGDDKLSGGNTYDNDKISGGEGDDTIYGGGGGDDFDGGDGFDTADFSNSYLVETAGADFTPDGGGSKSLTINASFKSIERIIGTKYDDTFTGDSSDNRFEGGAGKDTVTAGGGDDWIVGGADADTLDGGDSTGDTLSYLGATLGVTVTLGAAGVQTVGSGGDAAGDKIKNFENIVGGDGNDVLTGNALANVLFGDKGTDTLKGMAGNDRIFGGVGKDTIDGGTDNDRIDGGADADSITGNTGIDVVTYAQSSSAVTINLATNINKGGDAEGDKLFTVENIIGSAFDDNLTGGTGDNVLEGGKGADTITGNLCDVASYASSSAGVTVNLTVATQASAGDANGDKLIGILNLLGSGDADTLTGDGNANVIEGGGDSDTLDGGTGIDTLSYASSLGGVSIVLGVNGNGTGSGADAAGDMYANFENVTGGSGDDFLAGNQIGNVLNGGKGDDQIDGGASADTIDGGQGIDLVYYENSNSGVTVNLTTNVNKGGDADGDKLSGVENLGGSDFADKLTGDAKANTVTGGGDDDTLDGAGGNDILYGGAGKDTIIGNAGDDVISGDDGADVLDGGANIDTLTYEFAQTGIRVKLGEGAAALIESSGAAITVNGVNTTLGGGEAEGDSIKNFENLIGSAFGDVLVGNTGANIINGGLGNDNIEGGKGDDIIEGGAGADKLSGGAGLATDVNAGNDTLSYEHSVNQVDIDLGANIASGGDAQGDSIANFRNIIGGLFGDNLTGDARANKIEGRGGDDTFYYSAGGDTYDGGTGFNTISYALLSGVALKVTLGVNGAAATVTGTGDSVKNIQNFIGSKSDDIITGNLLDNNLYGGDGNDTIYAGGNNVPMGQDYLDGGAGIDTVTYATNSTGVTATINGSNFSVALSGNSFGETLKNFENIVGSKFDDTLISIAAAQANNIKGGLGNDFIEGGEGGDILDGEGGVDTLSYAKDTKGVVVVLKTGLAADVSGSAVMGNQAAGDVAKGFENLLGGLESDKLTGDTGANLIDGGANTADDLDGGAGNDTVSYASANSNNGVTVTLGVAGAATVGNGEAGENDKISNFENIIGSDFADKLTGSEVANSIFGGKGNDTLIGGGGADKLDGGAGYLDAVDYSMLTAAQGLTVTLGKDGAAATVSSSAGSPAASDVLSNIEIVIGGAGADRITGNNLFNKLYGGDGDDVLSGGGGSDTIDGGMGNDTITYAFAKLYVNFQVTAAYIDGVYVETVAGIENFIGSSVGDYVDFTNAGAVANKIDGMGGNDTIIGGDGADIMDGGANGAFTSNSPGDEVSYDGLDANISVTLGVNGAQTIVTATGNQASFANGDKISNFESVAGGKGNDTLTGNAGNNRLQGGDGDDLIEGGAGDDVLIGGVGNNTVSYAMALAGIKLDLNIFSVQDTGGAGKDQVQSFRNIVGSAKNDVLRGDFQINKIDGGLGDDTLEGGQGGDTLIGGAGVNTVSYEHSSGGAVVVDLNLQDGVSKQAGGMSGDHLDDILTGFANIIGSDFASDTLTGDNNANSIKGLAGNDVINGGGGADTLDGGAGIDTLTYATDNNAVVVTLGLNGAQTIATGISHGAGDKISFFENVTGGSGNDILTGNNLANIIFGSHGDDTIDGGGGDDTLDGGSGNNTVSYATATVGVTVDLSKNGGQNTLGAGNDDLSNFINLIGSAKNDTLAGNTFDNVIDGGLGDDTLVGGNGTDTASYASATAAVTVSLAVAGVQITGGAGKDTLSQFENLSGGKFNDILSGDANTNIIDGGLGDDTLFGGSGGMADTLIGGGGNDKFVFNAATDGGDKIADFGNGLDKIQISKAGFAIPATIKIGGVGVNDFAAHYFVSGNGAASTEAHGQFLFDTSTSTLSWDSDGTGGNTSVAIAQLSNAFNLQASHFLLV